MHHLPVYQLILQFIVHQSSAYLLCSLPLLPCFLWVVTFLIVRCSGKKVNSGVRRVGSALGAISCRAFSRRSQ